MNILDMRTVLISYLITTAICVVIMTSLWIHNRGRYPGLAFWPVNAVLLFIAMLAFVLRGIIPVSVSIMLGSPLVILGTILLYMGLERYVDKPGSFYWKFSIFGAFVAGLAYFTFVRHSFAARNIIVSLALLTLCCQCAWLLLRRVDVRMRPDTRMVGVIFCIYSLVSLGRIGAALAIPSGADLFQSGLYDTLVILIYQMLSIGLTFGLFLMVHRRLFSTLEQDILVRKQAEAALEESDKKFILAFHNSPYAITITDLKDGHIVDVNQAFFSISGYTREETFGNSSILLNLWVHESDRNRVVTDLLEGRKVEKEEFLFRKKNGDILTGLFSADLILLKDKPYILASINDITRRKQAEMERERLMAAIEQTGEVIIITDKSGAIQYVNPMFETVTGYSRGEAVGQTPRILKSGEQDAAFYRNLWETISSGKMWEGRFINQRKDGTRYTEEATISPVCDTSGRIVSYVAVKRDITEHLRLAAQFQQAQKMESVGRLAGGVAHDFSNMLGVIIGFANLALEKVDPSDIIYQYLQEVLSAARCSVDIIRQLLAFARKQSIEPQVLDLNETVENMLKMLRRLIGEDINLVFKPDGGGVWPIKMDPSQIDQILANLSVNARDAVDGVGEVSIETAQTALDAAYCIDHPGAVPGEYVLLAFSDNGCGMDPETQDKIFEPFFTTKETGKGTGLGLSTVYGIVKQNNGFIYVDSEPGKGTTFRIFLPRHADQTDPVDMDFPEQIPHICNETILVVEDDASILRLVKTILQGSGYTILIAETPGAAIQLAVSHFPERIDLLLTDVIMPGMNGRTLADRLAGIYPEMKCLYMSGYTADVIAGHGVLGKDEHFIQKPFSAKDLFTKVQTVLNPV